MTIVWGLWVEVQGIERIVWRNAVKYEETEISSLVLVQILRVVLKCVNNFIGTKNDDWVKQIVVFKYL